VEEGVLGDQAVVAVAEVRKEVASIPLPDG
jgi:hypothetical protein